MMKIIVMMKKWIRTCHTYKCKGKDDDGRGEALGGDGIIFFFSHSSFLVEKGGLLAVGGVEWEGFQRITTPLSFLHHSALHTTLFVHTPDGTNPDDSDPYQALLNKLYRTYASAFSPSSACLRATCLSNSRESP